MGEETFQLDDFSNYFFGLVFKFFGSFFLAYRFVLLKELDSAFDEVRENDPDIDQDDWPKVFEVLKEDILWYGRVYAMHKKDLYQYLAIIPAFACDVAAMLFLPFTLFGALNICAILIYQVLLVYILADPVDLNEWIAIFFLSASACAVTVFSPDPSSPLRDTTNQFEYIKLSLEWPSILYIVFLCVAKIWTFYSLSWGMKTVIELKDNEKVSDFYQPRPASMYNLMGPIHLAVNGAIWVLFIKSVLNASGDQSDTQTRIAYGILVILAFVFAGLGCSWGWAHSFHDMIGELHSATVFPVYVLLQTAMNICLGIVCFLEVPTKELYFWLSFSSLTICIIAFIGVMEYNEPVDQYVVCFEDIEGHMDTEMNRSKDKFTTSPTPSKETFTTSPSTEELIGGSSIEESAFTEVCNATDISTVTENFHEIELGHHNRHEALITRSKALRSPDVSCIDHNRHEALITRKVHEIELGHHKRHEVLIMWHEKVRLVE